MRQRKIFFSERRPRLLRCTSHCRASLIQTKTLADNVRDDFLVASVTQRVAIRKHIRWKKEKTEFFPCSSPFETSSTRIHGPTPEQSGASDPCRRKEPQKAHAKDELTLPRPNMHGSSVKRCTGLLAQACGTTRHGQESKKKISLFSLSPAPPRG